MPAFRFLMACLVLVTGVAQSHPLDDAKADDLAALAVADAALRAISEEDMHAFTDLWIEGAIVVAAIQRDGADEVRVRGKAEERTRALTVDVLERGWDPDVRVTGPVAVVWYPYDLYIDGAWSHCGVNVFNLVLHGGSWKIASITYSVELPPGCAPHPEGPPRP